MNVSPNLTMKTIAAFGAHHDDIEVGAAGTLAKFAQKGWRVIYIIVSTTPHYIPTPEEKKNKTFLSNKEAIEWRKQEAREGAKIIGVADKDIHFFEFKSLYWYMPNSYRRRYLDGYKQTDEEIKLLMNEVPGREFLINSDHNPHAVNFLMEFLDENEVDIALTQHPDDPHLEHYLTANFLSAAVMALKRMGLSINLYSWSESDARNMLNSFAPTHYIDISDTIDIKIESVKVFHSQFTDRNAQLFVDSSINRAKFYGKLVGMDYAEAFMKFNTDEYDIMKVRLPTTYDVSKSKKEFEV
jgi:N-acetylglucosamine malate deacetylase 1